MIIFIPAIAPFTPSVVLVVLTVPLAVLAIWGRAWRTGLLALLWSFATVIVSPINGLTSQLVNTSSVVILLPVALLAVTGFLYANYRTSLRDS